MLEIVDLFREKGTVDDLGFGVIRDALSDTLFPGVSVLHTRPRYLLFVGWIYAGLLQEGVSGDKAIAKGRDLELGLSDSLLTAGEDQGVIGRVAGRRLKRLPSGAYWAAIRTYGMLTPNLSLENYCRSIPLLRRSEPTSDDGASSERSVWRLLPVLEDFPKGEFTLALTAKEAHFLYERVMSAAGRSYLGWLLNQPLDEFAEHAWTHTSVDRAPDVIREALLIAEHYSLSQHGPALLYNLLVAKTAQRYELVDDYRTRLSDWAIEMNMLYPQMPYPIETLWRIAETAGARLSPTTRAFITWAITMTPDARNTLAEDQSAAQRIAAREQQLKGPLARLRGGRSLDSWSGASGLGLLDYRWSSVTPMVRDIVSAREGSHA